MKVLELFDSIMRVNEIETSCGAYFGQIKVTCGSKNKTQLQILFFLSCMVSFLLSRCIQRNDSH